MNTPLTNGLPQTTRTNSKARNLHPSVRREVHLRNEAAIMHRVQQTDVYKFYIRLIAKMCHRLNAIHRTEAVCVLWNAITAPTCKVQHPIDLLSVVRNLHNGTYVKNSHCLLDEAAILRDINHAFRNSLMLKSPDISFHHTVQRLLVIVNRAVQTRLENHLQPRKQKFSAVHAQSAQEQSQMHHIDNAKQPHTNDNGTRKRCLMPSERSEDRSKFRRVEEEELACSSPKKKVNSPCSKRNGLPLKKTRQVSLMFLSTRGLVQRRGKKKCCNLILRRHRILKDKLNAMIDISSKITRTTCLTEREKAVLLHDLELLETNHNDDNADSNSDKTLARDLQMFVAHPSNETETAVVHELEAQIAAVEHEIIHILFVKPAHTTSHSMSSRDRR